MRTFLMTRDDPMASRGDRQATLFTGAGFQRPHVGSDIACCRVYVQVVPGLSYLR
jgi:hypothetical protein